MTVEDPDEQFGSLRALLLGLGYPVTDDLACDLEDYVVEYVDADLGASLIVEQIDDPGSEGIHLWTLLGVSMWHLEFPVTRQQFWAYLDELDIRSQRMQAILGLPNAQEWADDAIKHNEAAMAAGLADLFGTTARAVTDRLGSNLVPIEADASGSHSNPVRLLCWGEKFVIGLDDAYAHLYRLGGTVDDPDADDIVGVCYLGEHDTLPFSEFADFLESTAARVDEA